MRFYANGPNVPNELLEERDRGTVVFFCGAGVSMAAGLPSFLELAKHAIDVLDAENHLDIQRFLRQQSELPDTALITPLDQVFGFLQREYGPETVEAIVSRRLRTPRNADLRCHKTVLRLARDPGNKPRIVTTNYDLLFEAAWKRLPCIVAPQLPDLSSQHPFEGLVYLHGRLPKQQVGRTRQTLVVGSADYGRAYLADGWATRFVRDLLAQNTVVLVGYSADDPPIRYLLEGLRSKQKTHAHAIYAFYEARGGELESRWSDRGVRAIPYSAIDKKHSGLWNTLRAWAERSDDPRAWKEKIVARAFAGPRSLRPYERGQVASIVSTADGARIVAESDTPLPAEWLMVFDPSIRRGKIDRYWRNHEGYDFDPLDVYGLDDDPPRSSDSRTNFAVLDYLSLTPQERHLGSETALAGYYSLRASPLPARLRYLAVWLSKVATQRAAVYWASGKGGLHEFIQNSIRVRSSGKFDCGPAVQKAWILLLEYLQRVPDPLLDGWHDLAPRIRRDGWTLSNLRQFEHVATPTLSISRVSIDGLRWLEIPDDQLRFEHLLQCKIEFPRAVEWEPSVPDDQLSAVIPILRRSLEHSAGLLNDLGEGGWWRTPTLHRGEDNGDRHLSEADAYFLCFSRLFERLCAQNPEQARRELSAWPRSEGIYFDKLRIWASAKSKIVDTSEVVDLMREVSDSFFWTSRNAREILWTLRARWAEFSSHNRQIIEQKFLNGPPRGLREDDLEFKRRRSIAIAVRLGWLTMHNCRLSAATKSKMRDLRAADPNWTKTWDEHADDSLETRTGWVRPDVSPGSLLTAPISELVNQARKQTKRPAGEFVEYLPFKGLVERDPSRAIAALSFEARHKKFPVDFWEEILNSWPTSASDRATWLVANRIRRLPRKVLVAVRHAASSWMQRYLPRFFRGHPETVSQIWDFTYDALVSAGTDAVASSIRETSMGGKPLLSRKTFDHALNSPVGHLVECLLEGLTQLNRPRLGKIPEWIGERLKQSMNAPSEGADHAVAIMGRHLQWLYLVDPNWTVKYVVPAFNVANHHAEAAWNAWLYNDHLPPSNLFALIKPHFLEAFRKSQQWEWSEKASNRLSEFLVVAVFSGEGRKKFVSFGEARKALRIVDNEGRLAALHQLAVITQQKWKKVGKPFLEKAWPRENQFQTAETSRALARLATEAGTAFPDASKTVLPFLHPTTDSSAPIFYVGSEEIEQLASKFPRPLVLLLDRLVSDEPRHLPYGLSELLEKVAGSTPSVRRMGEWRRLNDLVVGR